MPTVTRQSIIPAGHPLPEINKHVWIKIADVYYIYRVLSIDNISWTSQCDIKVKYQAVLEAKT
ncbi:hypothetical protein [Piscibacillus salipiscarius]|uniref:hypothetical protein n=1 Tax=Piscibacillus salipiscarius TaxID=299480 RepID=UPI0006D07B83|nr:hypothetical protein [Piscibacillus salipiscarius]